MPLVLDAEYGSSWHVTGDFFKENPDAHLKNAVSFQSQETLVEKPLNRYEMATETKVSEPENKAEESQIPVEETLKQEEISESVAPEPEDEKPLENGQNELGNKMIDSAPELQKEVAWMQQGSLTAGSSPLPRLSWLIRSST